MTCSKATAPMERALDTNTTTERFVEFGGWYLCIGMDVIRYVIKLKGLTGNFQGRLAYRLAKVRPDDGLDWVAVGAAGNNSESCSGAVNIASGTATKYYIQFGFGYNLSAGSTLARAMASLTVSWQACGHQVGEHSFMARSEDTDVSTEPITGFFLREGADKFKVAYVFAGVTGEEQIRFVYRTAATSTQVPGAWTVPAGSSWITAAAEDCTTEFTITDGNYMYVQIGCDYSLVDMTPGTLGQATVTTFAAVRKT